jgi:hypothetical protein
LHTAIFLRKSFTVNDLPHFFAAGKTHWIVHEWASDDLCQDKELVFSDGIQPLLALAGFKERERDA